MGNSVSIKLEKKHQYGSKRKSLDQESRPAVFCLEPDLPFECFRLSPQQLLFYSGEDGDGNNFMSLRCIVYFGSPNTRDWHTGVSAVGGQRWWMQEHVLAEGLKDLGCFSLEKGRLWGERTAAPMRSLCCAVPAGWMTLGRSWRRRGSEFPLELPPGGSQALEQRTQRLCDSILGVGESTPARLAQSLQQSGLTPALSRRLAWRHPKFPSNMSFSMIQWFIIFFPNVCK